MNTHIDGRHLKRCIKQAGYTLGEFSKELGIAKTTWYYYRTGTRPIPHKLRLRIEELLGCSFTEFFVSDQEPKLHVRPVEQRCPQ